MQLNSFRFFHLLCKYWNKLLFSNFGYGLFSPVPVPFAFLHREISTRYPQKQAWVKETHFIKIKSMLWYPKLTLVLLHSSFKVCENTSALSGPSQHRFRLLPLVLASAVGMPCPALCLVGPAFILLTWFSDSVLDFPQHYRLAWWSLHCGWHWFLSLNLLCSSCPDTVGLCPLSVRPLPLPALLSSWFSAHHFLQSTSLLLLSLNNIHCGL